MGSCVVINIVAVIKIMERELKSLSILGHKPYRFLYSSITNAFTSKECKKKNSSFETAVIIVALLLELCFHNPLYTNQRLNLPIRICYKGSKSFRILQLPFYNSSFFGLPSFAVYVLFCRVRGLTQWCLLLHKDKIDG